METVGKPAMEIGLPAAIAGALESPLRAPIGVRFQERTLVLRPDVIDFAPDFDQTIAGGVTVNDTILHIAQDDLPFGGVGPSGMGHYHGYEGFVTFSKMRPVFYQAPFSAIKFLWPPYGAFATKYLDFLTKR